MTNFTDDTLTCIHVINDNVPIKYHKPENTETDCESFTCVVCWNEMNLGIDVMDKIIVMTNEEFSKIKPTLATESNA